MKKNIVRYLAITIIFIAISNLNNKTHAECRSSCTYSYCPGSTCGQLQTGQFWISSQGSCSPSCSGGTVCCVYWTQCCTCGYCCTKVDGGWSSWSSWNTSYGNCDANTCTRTVTKTRTRSCTNPSPSCGGSNCSGSSTETQTSTESCTLATAPAAPTNLTYSIVGTGPSNVQLTWSNGSNWGSLCGYTRNNQNQVIIKKGTNTIYNSGLTSPIQSLLTTIECGGTYPWSVTKSNGQLTATATATTKINVPNSCGNGTCNTACGENATNCGQDCCGLPEPTITAVTGPSNLGYSRNPIELSATASGNGISTLKIYIDKLNSSGAVVTAGIAESPVTNCTGTPCINTFNWTPSCGSGDSSYFSARAVATNSCGLSSPSTPTFPFRVYKSYDLNITTKLMNSPVAPQQIPNCSDPSSNTSGIVVSANATNAAVPYTSTKTSINAIAGFTNIPQNVGSLNIDATLSGAQCTSYNYYCTNNLPKSPITISTTGTDCSAQNATVTMAETKRTSWTTIIDGNVYAKSADLTLGCNNEITQTTFPPTLISTGPNNIGGYLITPESIFRTQVEDIYNPNGGFAQKVGISSSDKWLNNFVFPGQAIDVNAKDISSISSLNEQDKIYYINKDLNINTSTTYKVTDTAIVYVNGNLNIKSNIISEGGFIIFVVKGDVYFDPSVQISNYSVQENFNVNSAANINAGIISLSKEGGIHFPSNAPDAPIIIEGFLVSKNIVEFNRDLGSANSTYPAHVIRYNNKILPSMYNLINTQKTGLESIEVQWNYE